MKVFSFRKCMNWCKKTNTGCDSIWAKECDGVEVLTGTYCVKGKETGNIYLVSDDWCKEVLDESKNT